MAYVSAEQIQAAREIDLLSYLRSVAPQELVPLGNDNYCTKSHDSLKISNGKWHWFSRGIGGKSAVDYLVKVQGFHFVDAVLAVTGNSPQRFAHEAGKPKIRAVLLPAKNDNSDKVRVYLVQRGISESIIDYCLKRNLLYESADYHNAVFVGYDENGTARYAALRGTGSRYKGEASGSDKHYSFQMGDPDDCFAVHLFEAAIDALSYATLMEMQGVEWQRCSLLSLAGVFETKRENVVPIALQQYLQDHPNIQTIYLHLDNDEVGRKAASSIANGLKEKYEVVDVPPPKGKDVNDFLMFQRNRMKEEYER